MIIEILPIKFHNLSKKGGIKWSKPIESQLR